MIGQYYEHSRLSAVADKWNDALAGLGRGYRRSRLSRGIDSLSHVTRQSRIVRWLTTDPDPDVVVIDLGASWTVGPVVSLVDRSLPPARRAWRASAVRRLAERANAAVENAPVQIVSALVLVTLVVQVVTDWASASDRPLALLAFLAAPALLGLRIDWTWEELVESRVGQIAVALLVPPEPSDEDAPDEETR